MTIFILIVGVALLILLHEAGHFFAAKAVGVKIEEFGIGFPPRLFKKKIGETLFSLNLIPFGGFVRLYGETGRELESNVDSNDRQRAFFAKSATRRTIVIVAGVLVNFIIAWIFFTGINIVGAPEKVIVTGVALNSPAAESGILVGDLLPGFKNSEDFINFINGKKGEETSFSVVRGVRDGASEIRLKVVPRITPPPGEGALGVQISEVGIPRLPFLKAIGAGLKTTYEISIAIILALGQFAISIFSPTKEVTDNFVGPVGIIGFADQLAILGPAYLIQLLAVISVNLAVLNLLPIPALDGGRLLFILIEKIRGRPVAYKRETIAHALGFLILIVLMVFITARDIARLL